MRIAFTKNCGLQKSGTRFGFATSETTEKEIINKPKFMKRPPGITTVESKVLVPVDLLEEHVNSKHHPYEDEKNASYLHNVFAYDFENILCCSEELEVDGAVEIHMTDQGCWRRCITIPVTTALLVICSKTLDETYKWTWSCSLS